MGEAKRVRTAKPKLPKQPMKFEPGKFYATNGRKINIISVVETTRWGYVFAVEEVSPSANGMSFMSVDSEDKAGIWVEISQEEWLESFVLKLRNIPEAANA